MINAIQYGIFFGVVLSFSFGPSFFELINMSMRRGFWAALFFEIGVIISDLLYLAVALLFANYIIGLLEGSNLIKIIGGTIFIIFGAFSIYENLKKRRDNYYKILDRYYRINRHNKESNLIRNLYISYLLKGIYLNLFNPMVMVFWIVFCTFSIKQFGYTQNQSYIFLAFIITSMLFVDILKIYFASKLKKIVNDNVIKISGLIIGTIMFIAGVYVLFVFDVKKEIKKQQEKEVVNSNNISVK